MGKIDQLKGWIVECAKVISKRHYSRIDVETFFLYFNLMNVYETSKEKSALLAYNDGINEWIKNKRRKSIKDVFVSLLESMKWNLVADEIKRIGLRQVVTTEKANIWNGPQRIHNMFIGRENYLKQIDDLFKQNENSVVAIVGIGGIGKTSLISQYVKRNGKNYKRIIWFNSNPKDDLIQKEFLKFSEEFIQINHSGGNDADKSGSIIKWFENNPSWLIVFDNIEDLNSIKNYMPNKGGNILITTRNRSIDFENKIEINKFELSEVQKYLKEIIPKQFKDESDVIEDFAKQLEFHPLAISQAVYYIKSSVKTIKSYIEEMKKEKETFKSKIIDQMKLDDPFIVSNISLFTTFMISIRKVYSIKEEAIKYLNICAFFLPEKIPRILFPPGILKILNDYSLITFEDESYFFIHRLIQTSLLFKLSGNPTTEEDLEIYPQKKDQQLKTLNQAYKLIDYNYPLGKTSKSDIILKYHLLSHYISLLNYHNKLTNKEPKNIILPIEINNYQKGENSKKASEIKHKVEFCTPNRNIGNRNFTIMNGLNYYESFCKSNVSLDSIGDIKESLNIFQLLQSHAIEIEISHILDIYYGRKILFEKYPDIELRMYTKKFQVPKIKSDLGCSYYCELNGLLFSKSDDRYNQFIRYSRAYEYQRKILNPNNDWISYVAKILSENRSSEENVSMFAKTLNQKLIHETKNLIYENYHSIISSFVVERENGISIFQIIKEIIRVDLKWTDISDLIDSQYNRIMESDIKLRNDFINIIVKDYNNCQGKMLEKFINEEIEFDEEKFVKFMYNINLEKKGLLLMKAVQLGFVQIVKCLLDKGANVDIVYDKNMTPLHKASKYGYFEIAKSLIDKGANVNAKRFDHWTPLHSASRYRYVEIVKLLLENGADVNAVNNDDWTPLHIASRYGNVEIVQLILEKGANVNDVNVENMTPLQIASRSGNEKIVKLLTNIN